MEVQVEHIFNTCTKRMIQDDVSVVNNTTVQSLSAELITFHGDCRQTRSFYDVDGLFEAMNHLSRAIKSDPIHIGNPIEFNIRQLTELIRDKLKPQVNSIAKPFPKESPLKCKLAIKLAEYELGWRPKVHLKHGLVSANTNFEEVVDS